MHDDDRPVGRRLSRRELVGLFGASVAAVAATSRARDAGSAALDDAALPQGASLAAQDCIALPQQTEGPYFVEERLKRSDIRVDPSTGAASPGIPLDLRLVISHGHRRRGAARRSPTRRSTCGTATPPASTPTCAIAASTPPARSSCAATR